jgi:ELWxxDGT repeat protein
MKTSFTQLIQLSFTIAFLVCASNVYAQKPIQLKLGVSDTTLLDIENIGNATYFKVRKGPYSQLWKTDGSQTGTVLVKDSFVGDINNLVALNGVLYFLGKNTNGNPCIYKSNGTRLGTSVVKSFTTDSAKLFGLSIINNVGYFSYSYANPTYNGIWKTDGTDAGTVEIKSGVICRKGFNNQGFLPAGSSIIFWAHKPVGTYGALWRTDGTNAGTFILKDSITFYAIDFMGGYVNTTSCAIVTFTAGLGGASNLYRTDGSLAGTYFLRGGSINNLTLFNNNAYYTSGSIYKSLGKTDGATYGAVLGLTNIGNSLGVANNQFYLGGKDNNDWEPYISDGTPGNTLLLKNIRLGSEAGGSDPRYYTAVGNTMYFVANDYMYNNQIYKSNGTSAGTVLAYALADSIPGFSTKGLTSGAGFLLFVDKGNTLYTLGTSGTSGSKFLYNDNHFFQVFPNPSTGMLFLTYPTSEQTEILVLNSLGQEVFKQNNAQELNLSFLPKGIYTLSITSESNTYSQRIILQ